MSRPGAGALVFVLAVLAAGCFGGRKEAPPPSEAPRMNAEGLERLERGDVSGAKEMFRRALAEAERYDDLQGRAEASNNMGGAALAEGEGAAALAAHDRALAVYRTMGKDAPEEAMAKTLMNRGAALLALGRTAEAAKAFGDARATYERLDRPLDGARAKVALAAAALARKDPAAALALAREAEATARKGGDDATLAAALSNVAAAEEAAGRLDAARNALIEALEVDKRRRAPAAIAGDLRALSRLSERRGEAGEARAYLVRAALVECRLGRHEEAERDLGRAVGLARSAGANREVAEAEARLAEIRAEREKAPKRGER